MRPKTARFASVVVILVLVLALSDSSWGQAMMLSGKVTSSSGALVPNAEVVVRNVTTGQSTETTTDANGVFSVPSLEPGEGHGVLLRAICRQQCLGIFGESPFT